MSTFTRSAFAGAFFTCVCSVAIADYGRTQGSFDVSPTGAATYSIPIWTPPGPSGLAPTIALNYSSQADNGLAGVGWSLSAVKEISRCDRTRAQDGAPAAVDLSANDRFCIGGNRLRLISGTYGGANSVYYTEIADYSRITAFGTAGSGPQYFVVEAKSGLKYEYGVTADSRVLLGSTALRWMLNKVYDRNNNKYEIVYNSLPGFAVPDSIKWTPTSLGASTYAYEAKFNYDTNRVDKDSYIGKVAGYDVSNRYRLATIQIKSSSVVVRKYRFVYDTSTVTSRSRLTSAKECADDAETNCLSPITFAYQTGQAGISGGAGLTPTGSSNGLVAGRYDLNGDGKGDLLFLSGGTCYATFGATNGFSAPVSVGTTSCGIVDKFLPGGRDAILVAGSPAKVAYWNDATSSFTTATMGFNLSPSPIPTSADYDGDGLADIVQISPSFTAIVTRRNTSSGSGAPSFSSSTISSAAINQPNATWGGVWPKFPNGIQRADFDGDGTQDLSGYYLINTGFSVINYYVRLFGSSAGYTAVTPVQLGTVGNFPGLNFNDDACTDIVVENSIQIAPCNGAGASTVPLPATPLLMLDWDGDRKTDILVDNGGNFAVYLSTGTGFFGPISTSISSSGTSFGVDVDGDGMDDMVKPNGTSAFSYWTHTASGLAPPVATNVPDLLNSVTDGFGVNYTPSYISTAWGSYSPGSVPAYPLQYTIAHLVVAQVNSTDGIGGTYNKAYQYVGARFNADRGDAGFQRTDVTDSRNGLITRTYFDQTFPIIGMVNQTELMQSNGVTPIRRTVITNSSSTLDSMANNQRFFVYPSASTTTEYEVSGTWNGSLLRTVASADLYETTGGTLYDRTVTTTEPSGANGVTAGGSWVERTYLPTANLLQDTTNWCLGRPQLIQQINSSNLTYGASITRTTNLSWNAVYCRPTQTVAESGNSTLQVTTDIGYDGFGNVSSTVMTGTGMDPRSTTSVYSDASHTTGQFPLSIARQATATFSETTTFSWNYDLGLPLSSTDPNGLVTSVSYDSYGRRSGQTLSDGQSTTWTYSNCTAVSGGCVGANNRSVAVKNSYSSIGTLMDEHLSYLDAFDRTLITRARTLSGTYSRVDREYDALGRVYRESAPCDWASCTQYWTTNGYDFVNRVTSVARPISDSNPTLQTTNIYYEGLSTRIVDPLSKQSTKIVNAADQLARSVDHDGYYQAFDYDAFGDVKRIQDSLGNTLQSSSYDLRGALTARTDMDMGGWSFTPNALGELASQTDAKSQVTSFTYDRLGRLIGRTEPEGASSWTYGVSSANKDVGQITNLSGPGGYSEVLTYNPLGRPVSRTITAGGSNYQFNYAFNTVGLLSQLTYPSSTPGYRLKLLYEYQNRRLVRIKDFNAQTTIFWTANANNPRDQVTQETLLNGVVTSRSYDAVTGWLKSIQSGVGGGTGVQNLSYGWDNVGNLTQRKDINQSNLTETFTYDNLYRLDTSSRNGVQNLNVDYDLLGNITNKSDVGAYNYHASKKHQVVSTGSPTSWSFSYDANGNMTTGRGANIAWTSYNSPSCIRTGAACSGTTSDYSSFDYTPDRQYWRQISNYTSGGTATTIYAGGVFERVTTSTGTEFRHYIRAGGSTIVVSRQSSGTNNNYYVTSDSLGSSSAVTNSAGTILVNSSFDAFGKRRGANWSGSPSAGDWSAIASTTRRGYTEHTMLDNLNLIHMNGRVQDPWLGRFLSADPFIPDPMRTQSYNRYSYVENNPLSNVDPSGFTPTPICYSYPDIRSYLVPGGATVGGSEGGGGGVFPGVGFGLFPSVACGWFDIPDPKDDPPKTPPNEPQTPDPTLSITGWLATDHHEKVTVKKPYQHPLTKVKSNRKNVPDKYMADMLTYEQGAEVDYLLSSSEVQGQIRALAADSDHDNREDGAIRVYEKEGEYQVYAVGEPTTNPHSVSMKNSPVEPALGRHVVDIHYHPTRDNGGTSEADERFSASHHVPGVVIYNYDRKTGSYETNPYVGKCTNPPDCQ